MKLIYRIAAFIKGLLVKKRIKTINSLHDSYYAAYKNGKKIRKRDRKNAKNQLKECKSKYEDYLQFCENKNIKIPDDFSGISEIIEETEDLLDPKGKLDRELTRETAYYNQKYSIVNASGEKLLNIRNQNIAYINDAETLINSIANTPKNFDAELKEICINKEKFTSAIEFGKEQHKALKHSAVGSGAGIAAGAGVASMAPTAAMWVATTFGTASTGTAISALSGAAATNAALAWLGGGALAAGGGGMAAGQALLTLAGPVGWGIAGTSLLTSVFLMYRKRIKLEESKRDEIARIKNCTERLKELDIEICALSDKSLGCEAKLVDLLDMCNGLRNQNYLKFNNDQKFQLGELVNAAKSLSALVSETIGGEDNEDDKKRKNKKHFRKHSKK